MALHKMIRLLTQVLGGQAYLNFMGNEFGHPDWIDFPREGNQDSFKYCRRQWSLLSDKSLLFNELGQFDIQMNALEQQFGSMIRSHFHMTLLNEDQKLIIFEKGKLLFIFNFSDQSWSEFQVGTKWASDHLVLLSSDARLMRLGEIKTTGEQREGRPNSLRISIPSRCCFVLCSKEEAQTITNKSTAN